MGSLCVYRELCRRRVIVGIMRFKLVGRYLFLGSSFGFDFFLVYFFYNVGDFDLKKINGYSVFIGFIVYC